MRKGDKSVRNKTAKTRMTVGEEVIDSLLNSLFCQKISVHDENFNQKSSKLFKNLAIILNLFQHLTNKHRLTQDCSGAKAFNAYGKCPNSRRQFIAQQGLRERCFDAPQGVSLTPIKAFSVAEAMIALLIGSLILGYSAPMITGQIKHNNMSDVQAQVLNRKIEELRSTQANIPSGAVMYFDLASCPVDWSPLSTIYPNAANAFIRNQSGSGRALGDWQQNAAPNIEGKVENFVGGSYFAQGGTQNWNKLKMSGAFRNEYVVGAQFHAYYQGGYLDKMNIYFDASENGTTAYGRDDSTEVRPDNIVLLACRKN